MTTVYARLQVRRDTSANWEAENPILEEGEIGFATDAKAEKIGDGVTAWNDLLSRPSQEQLLAVQAAAEIAAGDAQQRLDATVAAQTATETARDETQTLRDQTYGYKQDVASAIVYQDLASIAEQQAITMVAGCVYDTRLDTDGGAWRDRCQGTSWYNEPLNTAARGSRKDFPTVAVIIAEADKVTIFDGDDPALPMWMVILAGANYTLYASSGSTDFSIAAKNGTIAFGTLRASVDGFLFPFSFVKDDAYLMGSSGISARPYRRIADRNVVKAFPGYISGSPALVSTKINDVAMTVLPDAPVDPETGLQVPTIAVATDGGLSVIKHDGTVANIGTLAAQYTVDWLSDGLFFVNGKSGSQWRDWIGSVYTEATVTSFAPTAPTYGGFFPFRAQSYPGPGNVRCTNKEQAIFAYSQLGGLLTLFLNSTSTLASLAAQTTSTFTTGWLPGDMRGAFLASTDQADLVGGDVSGTLTNNTLAGFTSTGVLTYSNDGSVSYTYVKLNGLEAGKLYYVTANVTSYTQGSLKLPDGSQLQSTGTISGYVAGTGAGDIVLVGNGYFSATVEIASVQLADADRSVKGKGMIVHGTVPRAPVATGAELVGYSGFSTTNHLEQPYNADLDFGTGDFCVMGWRKGLFANSNVFVMRDATGTTGKRFGIYMNSGNYSAFVDTKFCTGPGGHFSASLWDHIVFIREANVLYLYVNGVQVASLAVAAIDVTNADATLKLGCQDGGAQADTQGTLALWRITATPPTAEQIAKIYRDERRLFQPGAACTLYGASDAVTALAHDPVTGLLHAGTSAGRSDIDGLLRVGNTQTPVAAAIAASGGMILEG